MNRQTRKRIEIKQESDLLDIMTDMVDDFLEDFREHPGLTLLPTEDDLLDFDHDMTFMYTQKGMRLYERYHNRLKNLYGKYFPVEHFDLNCTNIIFP